MIIDNNERLVNIQINRCARRSKKALTAEPRALPAKSSATSTRNRAQRPSAGPSTARAIWSTSSPASVRRPTDPSLCCATRRAPNSTSGRCCAGPPTRWACRASRVCSTCTRPAFPIRPTTAPSPTRPRRRSRSTAARATTAASRSISRCTCSTSRRASCWPTWRRRRPSSPSTSAPRPPLTEPPPPTTPPTKRRAPTAGSPTPPEEEANSSG